MKVSIAIPFYNAEPYLLDAIKSVFAQTYTNWELILIDDGSTDNSLEIAKSIKDSRVRVYSDGKNKKLACRLNEIVKLAKYDIIARMDADDLMSPTRLEKQILILKSNLKIDLVSTGLYSVTNNLELEGVRWHHSTTITLDDLLYKRGCGIVHASILGRKEWFLRNPYNESLKVAQDYDLWIKSAYKNDLKIYLIQEPLYYYREDGNINIKKMNLSRQYERTLYRKFVKGHFSKKYNLLIISFLKSTGIFFLSKLNMLDVLRKRRNKVNLESTLISTYIDELQVLKNIIL
jgi:glycosyltransferase involved in cell wall biosynthesis